MNKGTSKTSYTETQLTDHEQNGKETGGAAAAAPDPSTAAPQFRNLGPLLRQVQQGQLPLVLLDHISTHTQTLSASADPVSTTKRVKEHAGQGGTPRTKSTRKCEGEAAPASFGSLGSAARTNILSMLCPQGIIANSRQPRGIRDLCALGSTSRSMQRLVQADEVWLRKIMLLDLPSFWIQARRPGLSAQSVTAFIIQAARADTEAIRANPAFRQTLMEPPAVSDPQAMIECSKALEDAKEALVNVVGSYILAEAKLGVDFDNAAQAEAVSGEEQVESASAGFRAMVIRVVEEGDPQFVLKLARYTRHELGIRRTANFLLALASTIPECRPYVRRYFPHSVRLPSDVLEVAELHQKIVKSRVLASCLRKGIADKFPSFSEHQLAKYNNEKAVTKQRKKAKDAAKAGGDAAMGEADGSENGAPLHPPTMKMLIRTLHIKQPVGAVMKLLGKKYPTSQEEYAKSGLQTTDGDFDPSQAGARMKLQVPMTWETQLSARGNSAQVWEDLIRGRNLPFTAMIRNLRNVLQAGVSGEVHQMLLARLRSAAEVGRSGTMPMKFLSAFQAIDFEDEQLKEMQQESDEAKKTGTTHKVIEMTVGAGKTARKIKKKKPIALNPPTAALLSDYRSALDAALQTSVSQNLPSLAGNTLVLCDVSGSMDTRLGSAFARKQQLHQSALTPHAKSTGRAILEGEDYDLDDYFSTTGQTFSKKLSMSMIWIGRDLDLSCSFLDESAAAVGHCSYTNLTYEGCAVHSGDITDAPNGAEEVITLDLSAVPENVQHIVFTVNSYSGEAFDEMKEAAISLRDDGLKGVSAAGTNELCAFRLAGTGSHKAVVACSIFRRPAAAAGGDGGWVLRCLNSAGEGQTVHHLAQTIAGELKAQQADGERSCRRLVDVAMVTGLCLQQSAEKSSMKLFASGGDSQQGVANVPAAANGTVLSTLKTCHQLRQTLGRGSHLPMEFLTQTLQAHARAKSSSASAMEVAANTPIDTIVIITDCLISPDGTPYGSRASAEANKSNGGASAFKHAAATALPRWLEEYRNRVNMNLRFVCIDLLGEGSVGVELGASQAERRNMLISGYSDSVLKYVAMGAQSQVQDVEAMGVVEKEKHAGQKRKK